MRKLHLIIFCFLASGIPLPSFAQLDHSAIFLNYKRSTVSNFLNAEFQIGNKDAMHYFSLQTGVNISAYNSSKYSPYYTGTVAFDPDFAFSEYISNKKGFQVGIGYCHYFKNLENEKKFIPYLGFDFNWIKSYDKYSLEYTQAISGMVSTLEKKYNFSTLTSSLQFGFIYTTEIIYYKFSLGFEYYLPINDPVYMPTDSYNAHSSTKLPLAGIEPSVQIGIGFKLF